MPCSPAAPRLMWRCQSRENNTRKGRVHTCDAGAGDSDGLRCRGVVWMPLQTSGTPCQHSFHTDLAAIAGPNGSFAEQQYSHASALHARCSLPLPGGQASAGALHAAIDGALAHRRAGGRPGQMIQLLAVAAIEWRRRSTESAQL